jgi:hypothetical protein
MLVMSKEVRRWVLGMVLVERRDLRWRESKTW